MIRRFHLVTSRDGIKIIEEVEFKTDWNADVRAMTKTEAMEGMGALGLKYGHSRVGRYTSEYYDVTEEQAVLVKLFMQ